MPTHPRGWPGFDTPGEDADAPTLEEAVERAADREELLCEALRIAGIGGWELDIASGTLSWSAETYRIFGVAADVPASLELFYGLVHPDDRGRMGEQQAVAHENGTIFDEEYRIVRPDGEVRHLRSRAEVVPRGRARSNRFLGIVQDVTDRHRYEARLASERAVTEKLQSDLIHISRVSAMGAMASALAHELNQPLAAIINYSAALRRVAAQEPDYGPVSEAVEAISANAHRAGEIIRRLRLMTTRGEVLKAPFELTPSVVEATHLALTGADVPVVYDIAPDLRVQGDRVQIQQVIVNLVRNAVEAMAGQAAKRIAISGRRADGVAVITVSDGGPGIAPDVLPTIFDSFFSTKEDGMGVGLAISRTIIEAHGGRISADSRPGEGTTFRFTLPLADEAEDKS